MARRSWWPVWCGPSGKNGVLYGLDAATGQVRRQVTIGAVANDFTTPSVGDGFMLVASTNRVLAFRGTP